MARTGDYSISGAGGLEFRAVEGVGYGRATSSDDYRIISGDPRRAIAEFGLDGVRTIGGALPESVRAHIVTDDVVIDQTGQVETLLIDDARFRAEDHAARTSWLAEWGLLRDFSAPAEPYLVGGEPVPDRAAPGEVVVRLWSDANELDGRVQRMELDVPVLGGTVVYELTEVLEVAPTITAPEL